MSVWCGQRCDWREVEDAGSQRSRPSSGFLACSRLRAVGKQDAVVVRHTHDCWGQEPENPGMCFTPGSAVGASPLARAPPTGAFRAQSQLLPPHLHSALSRVKLTLLTFTIHTVHTNACCCCWKGVDFAPPQQKHRHIMCILSTCLFALRTRHFMVGRPSRWCASNLWHPLKP